MSTSCDVIIIGTGPGGEALASRLSGAGLSVVAVESGLVGGECPYWGCVPSKIIVRAADAVAEARRAGELADVTSGEPDFAPAARRIREEATTDWDDTIAVDRLVDAGVQVVRGHGRLVAEREVEVELPDGQARRFVAGRGVVLNTGTRPGVPDVPGLAGTPFWTNHEILESGDLPASLAVIGGGPIGLELAQAFGRLGSDVTVLEVGPRILGPEEPESAEVLTDVLGREGVRVLTEVKIASVSYTDGRFAVDCGDVTVGAERLLVAAGRRPRIDDVGLETVGLDPSARSVEVDDEMRAGPGLWAIGDIAGRGAFTHLSMYQSERAARSILGEELGEYDTSFPRVTFTDPEVGGVGLTEKQARERGLRVGVGTMQHTSGSRGFMHGPGAEGLVKLVVDLDRDLLVGATSVGPAGGETLSGLAVAVRAEVPLSTLRNSVYAYPTFWRDVESALADVTPS
ncbi:dihydrolipoyl dehydrogenase family protein [Aeromicrobium sp. CF4.19]|uniref:dihydrolipoyl dehydrogenase family protein n=1 Tax=Aeromicrobium sp. CF4.19 TaxID=3373082 RepID=UPI003EE74845